MPKRNPAPLSGALFIRNPRRKRRGMSRRRNGLAMRTNGLAMRTNGLAMRTNQSAVARLLKKIKSKSRRKNGTRKGMMRRSARRAFMKRRHSMKRRPAMRRMMRGGLPRGVGRLPNGRFYSMKKMRKNGLAMRANGLAMRTNGTKKGMYRKTSRRAFMRHNRRNGVFGSAMLSRVARRIPLVGKQIAPRIAPALTGALSVLPVIYAMKHLDGYFPAVTRPFGYTLGTSVISMLVGLIPSRFVPKQAKFAFATSAVGFGAAIDVFRYFSGSSDQLNVLGGHSYDYDYSDGMAYDVIPMAGAHGGTHAGHDLAGDYMDATMADAHYSAIDLTPAEGQAAILGAPSWRQAFGPPPRVMRRQYRYQSRHAGQPGHQWGWLIRLVGFESFRKIAAMPVAQRQALLAQIKADAQASVATALVDGSASETAGLAMNYNGALYAGAAY